MIRRLRLYLRSWRVSLALSRDPQWKADVALSEKHMAHYLQCGCLGDSVECCVPSCECHTVEWRREQK